MKNKYSNVLITILIIASIIALWLYRDNVVMMKAVQPEGHYELNGDATNPADNLSYPQTH